MKISTELEKMLNGELYNAGDTQLTAMRLACRQLLFSYNQTPVENTAKKGDIIRRLFGSIGKQFDIQAPFYCDYGSNIFAGENLFINFNCIILDCARITLGANVFLAPNAQLYAAYHPLIAAERIKGLEFAAPITIGNNVWLGGGAIVCPGVTIGDNTTIGAGSVVTKNIPAGVLAVGNPCRVVRQLEG